MHRIGIDVGGTNIAAGVVDENNHIIRKASVKTAEHSSPTAMIKAIGGLVKELSKGLDDIEAVGVGVPGTAEPDTGKILYANNLGFEDVPFLP